MKRLFFLSFLLCFITGYIRGQSISPSTLNGAGGSAVISGNVFEWSVAEMTLVNTATASNIVVTQGLLQPAPASTGIRKGNILGKLFKVYPNPTSGVLYIQYNVSSKGKLKYTVQDIAGKYITGHEITVIPGQQQETINMAGLPNATYMLYINYQPDNGVAESILYKIDKLN